MGVEAALLDRRAYERQIERLHQRSLLTGRLYDLKQDEVSLASVVLNRAKVARLLARDIRRGRYALEPGTLRTIQVRNKKRQVFSCRLTDLIVHGVVADLVQQNMESLVSPRVFSYRKGFSALTPVWLLADYLREQRRAHRDPTTRHMYLLRRDVDSYTDSIPIDRGSPLWPMLEERLGSPLPPLITEAIRVELKLPDGGIVNRVRGLPMGQPISPVIANLYLRDLDSALEGISGGFYARYGDDFVFAHPDAAVAQEADAIIETMLERLSLTVSAKKRQTCYLTPAGRPSSEWPEAKGAPYVPFLGMRINADATIGLDGEKIQDLLGDISRRVKATAKTVRGSREDVGRAVCSVVNSILDPHSTLSQQRSALLLRRVVTDRQQLHQLDHSIARIVAQAVTGRSGARAFRDVPYRKLRNDWRLVSLVASRNLARRSR